MGKLKDTEIDGNLYVSEDIQIGDISVTDKIDELNDAYYNNPSYSNPNLLINGDFRNPINQRGSTVYEATSSSKYSIDRWKVSNKIKVTVNENSVTFENTDANNHMFVSQPLENVLPNGEYTLSCNVLSVNGKVWLYNSNVFVLSEGINKKTIKDSFSAFTFGLDVGASVTLEWAKMEQGSVATPFVPRQYAEELMLCQRYFIDYKPIDHAGLLGSGGNRAYIPMQILANMRTLPTVIHNITYVYCYYNGSNKGFTSPTISLNTDYELVFEVASSVGANTASVGLWWSADSKLQFDAEIY